MKLSKRLRKIASYIQKEEVVADIGCDHAQLCCYLLLQNQCKKAYACDVRKGPLEQAKKNIQYYNLTSQIETRLCDGLDQVEDDVTTIVIAGMGFETVQMILENNMEKLTNRKLIIQINKDVHKLREWISKKRFHIIQESVVSEDGHYYEIIVFDTKEDRVLTSHEMVFGKQMEKDFLFYSMWKYRLGQLERILSSLLDESEQYQNVLKQMKQIYEEFGSV